MAVSDDRATSLRLLCCADTHDRCPPTAPSVDVRLHAGDVIDGARPPAVPRAEVAGWFADESIPTYLVRGNHDTRDPHRAFRGDRDLSGRLVKIAAGIWVAGVGWHGERFYELPRESDLRAVCDEVVRQRQRLVMPGDSVVLLTHYPARSPEHRTLKHDAPDGGWWYRCVRELIDASAPLLVVEGHIHEWARSSYELETAGGRTLVINPGAGGAVVELDAVRRRASVEWLR